MKSFKITNVGSFMTQLLTSECFDSFLLEAATIHMAVTYEIDGRRNDAFYSKEDLETLPEASYEFIPWAQVRSICREMIKGSKAPVSFQFTLRLRPEYVAGTLKACDDAATADMVGSLALNIRLTGNGLRIVTGVALRGFTMDRSADRVWDQTMERFLHSKGIAFEEDV